MGDKMQGYMDFIEAAFQSVDGVPRGVVRSFECPECKGQAQAVKSEYNGHIRAECHTCGLKLME